VFLVSDFIYTGYEKALQIANKKHDIVAITITDPREVRLPSVGFVELEDAETGEVVLVDTSSVDLRGLFENKSEETKLDREKLFRAMNVDYIDISTDKPYAEPLIKFFRMRAKRFR
jgi:uncharacterized protein (DUF58 family)